MAKKNIILIVCSFSLVLVGMTFIGLTEAREVEYKEQVQEQVQEEYKDKDKEKDIDNVVEKTTTSTESMYEIEDRTTICEEQLESIYEDSEYIYYLSCIKSNTIYLVYSNGNEFTLKYALDKKMVSIEELINKGLEVIKESKNNIMEGN